MSITFGKEVFLTQRVPGLYISMWDTQRMNHGYVYPIIYFILVERETKLHL